jgi:type I restriction enzyme S subunit
MGEVIQLDSETAQFALGQRIVCLRGKRGKLDNTFLRYLLSSPDQQKILASYATGTTVLGISQKALRSVPISYPVYSEQEQIGELLAALDNKIEVNRRMNETLEASARALFRDWFVDFGPTRAKVEGGTAYLSPDIWAEFPNRLNDEGKPEGWHATRLISHTSNTKGRSYSSSELAPSTTALVTLKSFARGGGYRRDGLKPYIGSFKESQIVKEGEIIVAQTDVTQAADIIGRPARVISDIRFDNLVASLDVVIVRPGCDTYLDSIYLYGLTADRSFTQHALAHVTGTTVLHLSKDAMPGFEFALPSQGLVAAHSEAVAPILKRVAMNIHESDALAKTRDTLLPKLMSGAICIRDAESAVAALC